MHVKIFQFYCNSSQQFSDQLGDSSKWSRFNQQVKQNFENLFHSFLAYWHTDHVWQVSWESQKNCRKSSDWKKNIRQQLQNQIFENLFAVSIGT